MNEICKKNELTYLSPKFDNTSHYFDIMNIKLTKNMIWLHDMEASNLVAYNRRKDGSIESKTLRKNNIVNSEIYRIASCNDTVITGHA